MSLHSHGEGGSSSFSKYKVQFQEPKSNDYHDDFQIHQFSRLSLNSHSHQNGSGSNSGNRSVRSNSSLFIPSIPVAFVPNKSSDSLSLRSRNNRKNSSELQLCWKNSILGNMTFLNKSIAGKSSLYHHEEFNMQVYNPCLHKELSEKSCPVGNDETEKVGIGEEGLCLEFGGGRDRDRMHKKKFLKTKNLLRNLSSYVHKYIRYNQRCKKFVFRYYKKKFPTSTPQQCQQFHTKLIQWTLGLSLTNFPEYQKIWSEPGPFTSIYRQICYKYYREDLFCDVQASRLGTKRIVGEYAPQFVDGLLYPRGFTHFENQ